MEPSLENQSGADLDKVAAYNELTDKWIAAGRPDNIGDELDTLWQSMSTEEQGRCNAHGRKVSKSESLLDFLSNIFLNRARFELRHGTQIHVFILEDGDLISADIVMLIDLRDDCEPERRFRVLTSRALPTKWDDAAKILQSYTIASDVVQSAKSWLEGFGDKENSMANDTDSAEAPEDFVSMVCGFAFTNLTNCEPIQVLLVEKRRGPPGVIDRWNGPGGKVEDEDLSNLHTAMVREFEEETGAVTKPEAWTRFVEFHFDGGCVHFFVHRGEEYPGLRTGTDSVTDEEVYWLNAQDMRSWTVSDAAPATNLRWLVPLALEILSGAHFKLPIVVTDAWEDA